MCEVDMNVKMVDVFCETIRSIDGTKRKHFVCVCPVAVASCTLSVADRASSVSEHTTNVQMNRLKWNNVVYVPTATAYKNTMNVYIFNSCDTVTDD